MSTSTRAGNTTAWNVPNTLTWLRILMVPAVLGLFYLPFWWAQPAAGLGFALAGITDSLDGYYARKLGQTSRLGAFLDPVADKLIVAAALVLIVSRDARWFVVITAVVIIGREIAVSALREWMAEIGARGSNARKIGKIIRRREQPGCARDQPPARGRLTPAIDIEPLRDRPASQLRFRHFRRHQAPGRTAGGARGSPEASLRGRLPDLDRRCREPSHPRCICPGAD